MISTMHSSHTFTRAHMLKWERYSSVVIPPFSTSSMSGSERRNIRSFRRKLPHIVWEPETLTIPSTRPCIWCPFVILIGFTCHAVTLSCETKCMTLMRQMNLAFWSLHKSGIFGQNSWSLFGCKLYLAQVSLMSPVVLQLFPAPLAHVAGSSFPLQNNVIL